MPMTKAEFYQWWDEYSVRFPDTAAWMLEKGGDRLMGLWFNNLMRFELAEMMEATDLIFRGDEPKPAAYEREDTPAFLIRAIREIRNRRFEQQERERLHRVGMGGGKGGFPAGRLYLAMRHAMKSTEQGGLGMSLEDAKQYMRNKFDEITQTESQ